ncbi:hypothetical protein [Kitasatospora purpeofusca]|uniref:hypothetical protein n=1 Tax=Kitasatospora purpeofusca TaxID=67352 RepID=UPI002250EE64|nr:hypothetical protein [Kitasatospora purpeofusca]MCX4754132.1 hypothetical protein [Kitasatospora purpeofusca]WSR33574.1 hypothetical protein OG715_22895 [Kitasatospora purpeofusca]WSR41658.1 hypothetical protein OG196_22700 [Kitasatospora purpeofusca]
MSDDRRSTSDHEPSGDASGARRPDPKRPDPKRPDPQRPDGDGPKRPGPDGDGPRGNRGAGGGAGTGLTAPVGGESPMERLLREALAARAARITAQDLRPADPPKGPRNRRRPAYLVGLPLMGLAAAMVVGVLTVPSDTLADKGDDAPAATMSDGPVPTRGADGASPTGFPAPPADDPAQPVGEAARGTAGDPSAAAPGTGAGPGTGPVPVLPGEGEAPAPPGAGAGAPSPPPGGQSARPSPAAPAPSGTVRRGDGVALSFDGLTGTEAIVGAGPTTFSVTWRNTTQRLFDAVAPVVSVRTLTGAIRSGRSVRGRLQREEEGGGWTDVPLTVGSGAYLASGDAAAFPLGPGAARTLRYRLDPSIDSAEGTLLIEALAVLSTTPERFEEGSALAPLLLTSAPAAGRMAPELRLNFTPSDGVVAGRPSAFAITIGNPGAAPLASVVPTLALTGADAAKVVVETRYGAGVGVRRLPVAPDGNGQLVVDTSLLERLIRPHESKYLEFQVSVPEDWKPNADFAVVVGARGDGRDAPPVVIKPRFTAAVDS